MIAAEKPRVRVAAVQWSRPHVTSLEALVESLHGPLSEAVRAGAELAAFPAGVGDLLAAILAGTGGGGPGAPAEAFELARALGEELPRRFEELGCSLARAHRVTVSLGPVLAPAICGLRRVAYIFGPGGEVLGSQAQTHHPAGERVAGLIPGTGLAPVATPLCPVGLLSGVDVAYPEVGRILCLQGARILVHHEVLRGFDEALALSRLWREVQANQVFGLEAYAVGEGAWGRSAVHAPIEITADGSGWLARAPHEHQPAVLVADLDFSALEKLLEAYPIYRLRNVAQYQHYFPDLYEVASEGGRRAAP